MGLTNGQLRRRAMSAQEASDDLAFGSTRMLPAQLMQRKRHHNQRIHDLNLCL